MVPRDIRHIFTQVYKLTVVSDYLKKEVHYKEIKHKKLIYKNNNQYCQLTNAYYNLSISTKDIKTMFTVMSERYRREQKTPGLVEWEEAFGWLKNKIKKYDGREAIICVIKSTSRNRKKSVTSSTEA